MDREYIVAVMTNSQPTASAEIVLDHDVTEDDAPHYEVQNTIADHLPVGGARLGTENVHLQYTLVARHHPKTNIIKISWATPEEIIELGGAGSKGEVFEQLHPSLRDGYDDWENNWRDFDEDDGDF